MWRSDPVSVTAFPERVQRMPSTGVPFRPFDVNRSPLSAVRATIAVHCLDTRRCLSGNVTFITIHQLQPGHHAGGSQRVQCSAVGSIELESPRRCPEQHGDDALPTGIATYLAAVAIHDHVGSHLAGDLVTADGRTQHRQSRLFTDRLRVSFGSTEGAAPRMAPDAHRSGAPTRRQPGRR